MVHFSTFFALSAVASLSSAVPLNKRIAQTIADSTTQWVQACVGLPRLYTSSLANHQFRLLLEALSSVTQSLSRLSLLFWLQAGTVISKTRLML